MKPSGITFVRSGMGLPALSSGGFIQTNPTVQTPTGYVYDHGVHSYAAAPISGGQLAIPGLLPIFGKDDGALKRNGALATVTYPLASAISGTGDFSLGGLALVDQADAVDLYHDADTGTLLRVLIDGTQDAVQVWVANSNILNVTDAGINDGHSHLYALRRVSGVVELYVDGRLIGSASRPNSITAAFPPQTRLIAGAATIDEIAWWRRALTDTELSVLVAAANVITSSTGLFSGEWIERHLADFCFSDANIDTGSSMIDTPDLSTGDAALVLAQIAQVEDGMIFVDGSGALRSIGRNSFGFSTCTIGDTTDSDIPFDEPPDWSMDVDQVYNRIQVSKDGYPLVQADDLESQNAYGIRSLPWSANLLEASQMQDAANWLLSRYKNPLLRVDTVQVRGQGGDFAKLLALEIGDRVTVNHHPPGGTLLTAEVIVEHIEYQLAPDDWLVTLQLAPMPKVWILGDPVYGVLGSTTVLGW